jgi:hypothetical protein
VQKKKRVKSKDGAKSKPQFVMESVPCESFFNVFDPPQASQAAYKGCACKESFI